MDKHNETFDAIAKRIFGPAATIGGSIGSAENPGEFQIIVEGKTIGTGPTFNQAMQAAHRTAAGMADCERRRALET